MRAKHVLLVVVLALAASGPVPGAVVPPAPAPVQPAPVLRERQYTMNARVRPLLFWIRRNDVGEARITWRADRSGAYGYELLVGSDPLKAPRRINKWGYLAEHVSGREATIVGVMKQAKGESVEEAEAQLAREGDGGYVFETISASVSGDTFTVGTVQVRSPGDLTFRDVAALLARAARAEAPRRTTSVPAQTDPGFLSCVAALLRGSATAAGASTGRRTLPSPRAYVYNRGLYDLQVRSVKPVADFEVAGHQYGPALDADFAITNRHTRNVTKFSIVYGSNGELAAIPIRIVFRPKWWFEAELVLVH